MASSSASDSQYCPQWKYDVFLSFRGVDTRRTFTGHLYEGLKNRGIHTFQDDKRLEDGDSISEELLKAIEESQVSLIIFSKNYATSSWCLNELVKIMECKEKNGQTVIPIFYDVDPSHVRYQSESFKDAFTKHELRYKDFEGMQKAQAWRKVLTTAADLKGHDIRDKIESDCIQHIVDQVSSKLCKASVSYLRNVVGIDIHLEKVKSLLEMEVDDVRIVGIWGMGGIGKTTIARAIFDTNTNQFDGACFLADIKENKCGMHSLQNILLSEVLKKKDDYVNNNEDGKHMIAGRLRFKKVLVVLDDIDHRDHLDNLAGDLDWFGKGSRIIATTRNKQIIGKNNAVYEVTTLLKHDAIQLFNHYAFKDEAPDEHIKKLALEVVSHAKGLPLALKLWGIMLHNQDTTMWREVVDMVKRESSPDIVTNLKISFEGLQDKEKTIFLDIACFFRGESEYATIKVLESYDLGARIRLHGLIEKALVFISEYNTIQMHDLIQDMGRHVVELQKDSGKPTRIWNVEDFEDVMTNNTGAMAVEAIWLPGYPKKLWFNKEAMKNMRRLRILHIGYKVGPIKKEVLKNMRRLRILHIGYKVAPTKKEVLKYNDDSEENDGSIDYLSNNLCWFVWRGYPWKLLPQNFNPTRLVHLQLPKNSLHHLWNGTKRLLSLRRLDLNWSKNLKRTPDFTGMPNLEYLNLSLCGSLEEVHHSLKCSRKLIQLNLDCCKSLERFPYINVESLEYLNLSGCSRLEKFPEILGKTKPEFVIEMSPSGIREIPSSIIHRQAHLTELDLTMKNLLSLPSSICALKDLVKLNVANCSKLESLPEEIGDLEKLEELDARNTLILRPPSSIFRLNKLKVLTFAKEELEDEAYFVFPLVNEGLLSLEKLDLSNCNLIDEGLPEDIGSLSSLQVLNLSGSKLEHLPQSIAQLSALQYLELNHCNELKELPRFTWMTKLDTLNLSYCNLIDGGVPEDIGSLSSLKKLNLSNCNLIDRGLPEDIGSLSSLKMLNLSNCNLIDGGLPEDIGSLSSLRKLDLSGNNFEHLPQSISQLGALLSLDLSDCKRLKELPVIPQQLNRINVDWSNDQICNSLFQKISSLQHDISASDSLSLRVFMSSWDDIPSWFNRQGTNTVALRENWYDNYLGLAVCCFFSSMDDVTARLLWRFHDIRSMTQELSLSQHSSNFLMRENDIIFLWVPLAGLWDALKPNEKTPDDCWYFQFSFPRQSKKLHNGMSRSRDEEASCSSNKKPRCHSFPED